MQVKYKRVWKIDVFSTNISDPRTEQRNHRKTDTCRAHKQYPSAGCYRGQVILKPGGGARTSRQPGHFQVSTVVRQVISCELCELAKARWNLWKFQPGQKLFSQGIWPGTPWCSAATQTYSTEEVENDASARPLNLTSASCDTFDLLTSTVDRFILLPADHLWQFSAKLFHSFSTYLVHKLNWQRTTDGRPSRKHYASGQYRLVEA